MSQTSNTAIAVIGIDIGKNSFHVVGHDVRGAIVLRQKWSRGQVEARLANIPPCLIGMEACVGAHHLSRKLASLGHFLAFGLISVLMLAPRSLLVGRLISSITPARSQSQHRAAAE
jgi:transposase